MSVANVVPHADARAASVVCGLHPNDLGLRGEAPSVRDLESLRLHRRDAPEEQPGPRRIEGGELELLDVVQGEQAVMLRSSTASSGEGGL